jgi:UDP-glucuronate 4-epimerase
MITASEAAQRLRGGPPVLVTGAAGFIGFHLARRLLTEGVPVVGFDNLNAYYDPALKRARLAELAPLPGFHFVEGDLADRAAVEALFAAHRPAHVVHLAAQAGVSYSMHDPFSYGSSNLTGFLTILEACRHGGIAHLVYASSSSVYGGNRRLPYATSQSVDHPVSLYAATKKANELMAHAYCHLYGFPATGLRFFTVYGPWGRPDMACWKFTEAVWEGRRLTVNNHGNMARDFTHIDDIVEALVRLLVRPAAPDPSFDPLAPTPQSSTAPHRIYNIGANRPEKLLDMIAIIERAVGRPAILDLVPMPPGEVQETWADVDDLQTAVGFSPRIAIAEGLPDFVDWYRRWRSRPSN